MELLELQKGTSRNCLERKLLRGSNLEKATEQIGKIFVDRTEGREGQALSVCGEMCRWEQGFMVARNVTPGALTGCVNTVEMGAEPDLRRWTWVCLLPPSLYRVYVL